MLLQLSRRPAGETVCHDLAPLDRLIAEAGRLQPWLADWFWLQANATWESGDETATRQHLQRAVRLAPDVLFYRHNAARILAYDFPTWRENEEPGAPAALRRRWRQEAGEEALRLLFAAPGGPTAETWIEAGNVALHVLHDSASAAEYYRRAAESPGAPWHAGRIHARLLRESGQRVAALQWLKEWSATLPGEVPEARREAVLALIRTWEAEMAEPEPF